MTLLFRHHSDDVLLDADLDKVTAFEPVATSARYRPPPAVIDPDQDKTWLRRALPVVLAHKRIFITSLVLSFAGLLIQVQIPLLLQDGIENAIVHRRAPLSTYITLMAVLAVAAGIAGYIARYLLLRTAYEIEFDLRNLVYTHLTRMSFPFYDRVQSGQLISRANSDIRAVQRYLAFAPSILVQCSVALVAFGYMLSINVPLALVAMVPMPFVYFVGIEMRKKIFPVSWLIQSRLADVATIVDENISGVRIVKSFAAEQRQLTTLARAADRLQWSYVKDADIRASFTPTVQNLPQVAMALILLFGGWLALHGRLPIAAIVSFSLYIVMMQAPFQMLGMIIMMGQRAAASAQRVYEILDEQPTVVDRDGARDLTDCRGAVRFEAVRFGYVGDKPPVLDGFDLQIAPGQTVALVGRTGSGKSTVARLLARFYDVSGGRVLLDGHDVRDLSLTSLRSKVGIVLDEPFLFSVSIRDNIAYGLPAAGIDDIAAAARAAGADEFIRELPDGYDTVVGERGYTLSGGQRQRIAIARTLLVNPPVLVLDDATSAIDVQVELTIHGALRTLMVGRTTLIIAHRLSTISLADRVLLMDNGRIVADGTHADLMARVPLYAEVLAQGEQEDADRDAGGEGSGPRSPGAPVGSRRPGDPGTGGDL